jgi:hypothetical protein
LCYPLGNQQNTFSDFGELRANVRLERDDPVNASLVPLERERSVPKSTERIGKRAAHLILIRHH